MLPYSKLSQKLHRTISQLHANNYLWNATQMNTPRTSNWKVKHVRNGNIIQKQRLRQSLHMALNSALHLWFCKTSKHQVSLYLTGISLMSRMGYVKSTIVCANIALLGMLSLTNRHQLVLIQLSVKSIFILGPFCINNRYIGSVLTFLLYAWIHDRPP